MSHFRLMECVLPKCKTTRLPFGTVAIRPWCPRLHAVSPACGSLPDLQGEVDCAVSTDRRYVNVKMQKNDAQGEADCAATNPAPLILCKWSQWTSPSSPSFSAGNAAISWKGVHTEICTLNLTLSRAL